MPDFPTPEDPGPPALHHDRLSGREVYIAPRRARRPSDLHDGQSPPCPFCAGHEHLTPAAVRQWPDDLRTPWKARISPNRYPVVEKLSDHESITVPTDGGPKAAWRPVHGVHEVIVEAADHVDSILDIAPADWCGVWELCRQRLTDLANQNDLTWVTLFKNGGLTAGASLAHLHSQLIAIDRVPPTIRVKCQQLATSPELFTQTITDADTDDRILCRRNDVVALVPAAPRQPFEVWLVTEPAAAFFHTASTMQIEAVASLTRATVAALQKLVPGASFNWWLHQFPSTAEPVVRQLAPHWHWHLEILPRLTPLAGFELGTGCHINTVAPRIAAAALRETGCWDDP